MSIGLHAAQLHIKSTNTQRREIEGWASTPSRDREGDVLEPMGATFKLPLPCLYQHKHDKPVGNIVSADPRPNGIYVKARISDATETAREAWRLVQEGIIRTFSVGFRSIEREPRRDGGWTFKKWEVLEVSLVSIPANPDAVFRVKDMSALLREIKESSAGMHTQGSLPCYDPEAAVQRLVRLGEIADKEAATVAAELNTEPTAALKTHSMIRAVWHAVQRDLATMQARIAATEQGRDA